MSELRPELRRFVEKRFPGAAVERLAGDASYRIFYRISPRSAASVVLMDYGSPFEVETDDVRLGRVFRRAGLRVAELIELSPEIGILVLEDLGSSSLESVLRDSRRPASSSPPPELRRAVDLAAQVADRGTAALADSDRAAGPALDRERFRFEMDFFLEHFVGGLVGKPNLAQGLRDPLYGLADRAAECPRPVLCHRDFHSRNLMVLGNGSLAMVDIQDARWGPDTYDLASIVCDAYLEIDDAWVDTLVDRYLGALESRPEPAAFRCRFGLVAGQRMIKALGSFGWLTTVKRTDRYLEAIPRTLGRIDRLLGSVDETRALRRLLAESDLLRIRP